jgi:EAL domain-containing protein (putative c-di-GMP-specific phosphodiesterase class I)
LRIAKQKVNALQTKGIRVALNGFNLEPESLQLLQHLPAALLRIDREAVRGKEQSLAGLVKLAHEQGKQIIITKVEDARSLGDLWGYGVDFIQGDFVQAPETRPDFDFSGFVF